MTESQESPDPNAGDGNHQEQGQTFTQADVDKLVAKVRAEERRKAGEKFADYDALKARAGEAATVEDRLAAMEKRAADAEARALRADIANKHGISAEDRDLFLTGLEEATLTAQAQRLAAREAERQQQGNHVPSEGTNPPPSSGGSEREFVKELFGRALQE